MDVKSSTMHNHEQDKDQKDSADHNKLTSKSSAFNAEMYGSLSDKNNKKNQVSARYEVDLEAGQLPLPKGITTIIDIFAKNLTPIPRKD